MICMLIWTILPWSALIDHTRALTLFLHQFLSRLLHPSKSTIFQLDIRSSEFLYRFLSFECCDWRSRICILFLRFLYCIMFFVISVIYHQIFFKKGQKILNMALLLLLLSAYFVSKALSYHAKPILEISRTSRITTLEAHAAPFDTPDSLREMVDR